jgi:hypothetical protein
MAQPGSTQPLFVTIATSCEASISELDPHNTTYATSICLFLAHNEVFVAPNVTTA